MTSGLSTRTPRSPVFAAMIADRSVPTPPATSQTTPLSGHRYAVAMVSALMVVPRRIASSNTCASLGCVANHSQIDTPCTCGNALWPVRTVSASPVQASVSARNP